MFGLGIPLLHYVISITITFLVLAMLVRAVFSWFGVDERNAFIRILARLTDPFIAPLRKLVKPVGVLDISFLIAWFLLSTMEVLLLQALPAAW